MKRYFSAFAIGVLFALGLALSGMTQPAKIIGFFDFAEGLKGWDPSLALVMGGSMLIYAPVFRLVREHQKPLWDIYYRLPTKTRIDWRLIVGGALFGIGWGLGGFCPGPALASLGAFSPQASVFVASMLVGMLLFQRAQSFRAQRQLDSARAEHIS